ncbi:MAG: sigma-70 family RNA polymerase sigma factor [Rubrivivax sp.]|jgi:RNA polymerase sigma factor (TIGR02999 family)|nr:sigma-70 family RNA polymerase sigma factor [Rubrivivax sp.]
MGDITQILAAAQAGDRQALDKLFHALYPELKQLAHARLLRNAHDTLLNTTAVVHDCYLKLLQSDRLSVPDRARFFGYAASVMRSIIVDAVRASHRERRGGGATHLPLATDLVDRLPQTEDEILDVDAALVDLARLDPRLARVVEMRYFGGMTEAEIAANLGVSDRTVRRDWEKARLLLAAALRG